ncbi:hypothetical protein [Pelagibius sp. Alg239-R121]|uniref:hypothetical protein n=1 Tax=Pelagibius sp. Alg239-R121 TaxID=2993448 RepID=UPI0024A65CD6|nr:hypothetical protein [Pelagibius sp. Alg239-R121]
MGFSVFLGGVCYLGAWRIFNVAQDFVSASAVRLTGSNARNCRVLIMPLSLLPARVLDHELSTAMQQLTEAEEDDLTHILRNGDKFGTLSWQQNLRCVDRLLRDSDHKLSTIFIVTSKDKKAADGTLQPGSDRQFDDFKSLCDLFIKNWMRLNGVEDATIEIKRMPPVDFEEFDQVYEVFVETIENLCSDHPDNFEKNNGICVDITSGLKTVSAAAAIATLNRKVLMSYVRGEAQSLLERSENENYSVLFYDAQVSVGVPSF